MKVTLKELFNANYEACEVSLYAGAVSANGEEKVRFYIWINDRQNEIVMQNEFSTYVGMFDAIRFAPMLDEEQVELLKQINTYEQYWRKTFLKVHLTDDEMLAEWDKFKNGEFNDDDDFGDDYQHKFAFQFQDGTFIKADEGEDGITCHVEELMEEPKMGTFTDLENLLYGLAPIVQNHAADKDELLFMASHIKICFNSDMEMEDIVDILIK